MTNIPQHFLDAEMASAAEAADAVVRRPGERSDESSASLEHFLARGVAAQAAADRVKEPVRPDGELESSIASGDFEAVVRWARYYAQETEQLGQGPDLARDALHDVGYFLTGEMQDPGAVVAAAKQIARQQLGHGDLVDEYERTKATRDV